MSISVGSYNYVRASLPAADQSLQPPFVVPALVIRPTRR